MSVDRCVAVGYGMPISDEEKRAIYDLIESSPDEIFFKDYCRDLNSWTGRTAFLGIVNTITDSDKSFIIPFDEDLENEIFEFDWKELNKLYEFLNRIGALEIIQWRPDTYLLQFIY
jgi:hypothetical protein